MDQPTTQQTVFCAQPRVFSWDFVFFLAISPFLTTQQAFVAPRHRDGRASRIRRSASAQNAAKVSPRSNQGRHVGGSTSASTRPHGDVRPTGRTQRPRFCRDESQQAQPLPRTNVKNIGLNWPQTRIDPRSLNAKPLVATASCVTASGAGACRRMPHRQGESGATIPPPSIARARDSKGAARRHVVSRYQGKVFVGPMTDFGSRSTP